MVKTIYNDDDTLIDAIVLLEATYSFKDGTLIKNADIAEDVLNELKGAASRIVEEVRGRVDKQGPYAVLTFLAPSILGAVWAPLGIAAWMITFIGMAVNVEIGDVFAKAAKDVKEILDKGDLPTEEDADRIAGDAIKITGGKTSTDLFSPLRTLMKEGKLLSTAKEGLELNLFKEAIKPPRAAAGVMRGVFSKLIGAGAIGKARGLFLALLKWTIKNIIKGVVAVSAAGWVLGKTPGGPSEEKEKEITPEVTTTPTIRPVPKLQVPPKRAHNLTATGAGMTRRINSRNRVWIVPLVGMGSGLSNIANTMFFWATKVYNEVNSSHKQLVMTSPAFIKMVAVLSTNYSSAAPQGLQMPQNEYLSLPIYSIKDVVDYFIWQTAPQIKSKKESA